MTKSSTTRKITEQLEALRKAGRSSPVHYIAEWDRDELAVERSLAENLPRHIARSVKRIDIDGVEIRALEVLDPTITFNTDDVGK